MNNPFYIKPTGDQTQRAIINVLNIITQEMYDRKVPQVEENTEENSQNISTETVERKQDVNDLCDMIIDIVSEGE